MYYNPIYFMMIGVSIVVKNTLEIYLEHDIMTQVNTMKPLVADIPKDIKTIVAYVQNDIHMP